MEMFNSLLWSPKLGRTTSVAPCAAYQFVDLPSWNIERYAPIFNTKSRIIDSYKNIPTFIARLLQVGSPFAILWRVIAIIIDAFNRMSRGGPWPHINKEIHKINQPSLADLNTSASVSMIFGTIRVIASVLYFAPHIMLRCITLTVLESMIFVSDSISKQFSCRLFGQTATAKCSLTDIGCCSYCHLPALAFTMPHYISGIRNLSTRDNQKSAMSLSPQIKCPWHKGDPFVPITGYIQRVGYVNG